MKCQEIRDNLSAYLDKELPAELAAAVRVHVDQCAECRELLDDLRATADVLDRLPHCPAPEHLAADVQREIERRMLLASPGPAEVQEAPQERTLPLHRANPIPRLLGVAAALVLMVGIGVFAYLSGPGSRHVPVAVASKTAVDANSEVAKFEAKPADASDKLAAAAPHRRAVDEKGPGNDVLALATQDKLAETLKQEPATDKARKETLESFEPKEGLAKAKQVQALPAPVEPPAMVPAPKRPAPQLADALNATTAKKAADLKGTAVGDRKTDGFFKEDESVKHGGAPSVALDAGQMQGLIDSVAAGEAPVEKLKAVATQDNLKRLENQLVIEARSREAAGKDLVRLFAAIGLVPLASADRGATREWAMKTPEAHVRHAEPEAGERPAVLADGAHPPAGFYYPANHDGEDIWIVVTDRDNLSRFGSQLALADGLTVSRNSSEILRDVRKLQDQLRAANGALALGGQAGKGGGRGYVPSPPGAAASEIAKSGATGRPAPESDKSESRLKAMPEGLAAPPVEAAADKAERMDENLAKDANPPAEEKPSPLPKPAAARTAGLEIERAEPAGFLPPSSATPQAVKQKLAEGAATNSHGATGLGAPAPRAAPAKPSATVEKSVIGGDAGTMIGRQPDSGGSRAMEKREQEAKSEEKTPDPGVRFGAALAGRAGNTKDLDNQKRGLPSGIPWQPNQVILVIRVQQAASADAAPASK